MMSRKNVFKVSITAEAILELLRKNNVDGSWNIKDAEPMSFVVDNERMIVDIIVKTDGEDRTSRIAEANEIPCIVGLIVVDDIKKD